MTWVSGSPLQTAYQKTAAAVGLFFYMFKRPSFRAAFHLIPTYMAWHFKIANRKKLVILKLPAEKGVIFSNLPAESAYALPGRMKKVPNFLLNL
ncbi:MAG: hypothetical protein IK129_03215 [Deltaproteobacteria bacterium]|nr:hypothetical protein [Deltaproteobacteria bacterium]